MIKTDLSVLSLGKSQLNLYNTFISVRKEKPTEQITVVELCKAAGVNRSTFYRSYYDIFDLESKLLDYCVNAVVLHFQTAKFGYTQEDALNEDFFPQFSAFENDLALDVVEIYHSSSVLSKKMYDRMMGVLPLFLPSNCTPKQKDGIKTAFTFIVTGGIHLFSSFTDFSDKQKICETAAIAFSAFRSFIKKALDGLEFEPLPLSETKKAPVKEKAERLNVKKTKRSLKRAFFELLKNNDREKISVSKLCEKAEISNSTFYTHYSSIDDYVNSLFCETTDDFIEHCRSIYPSLGNEYLKLNGLFECIDLNQQLLFELTTKYRTKTFSSTSLETFIKTMFIDIQKDCTCAFDGELAFSFICHCAWGTLFEPFGDEEISSQTVLKLSYIIFSYFFKRKDASLLTSDNITPPPKKKKNKQNHLKA